MVRGAYLLPDRFQEPPLGNDELAVVLFDLSARYALITGMSGSRVEDMPEPPRMGLDQAARRAYASDLHGQVAGNGQLR